SPGCPSRVHRPARSRSDPSPAAPDPFVGSGAVVCPNSRTDALTPWKIVLADAALLAIFVGWEPRQDSPMIDVLLFLGRRLALVIVATAALGVGLQGAPGIVLPIIYQAPAHAPVALGLTATAPQCRGRIQRGVPAGGKIAVIGLVLALLVKPIRPTVGDSLEPAAAPEG